MCYLSPVAVAVAAVAALLAMDSPVVSATKHSHSHWAMTRLTFEDLKYFAELGCLLEFEASLIMPIMHFVHGETPTDPRVLVKSMKALGAENCFISSDLGQIYSPLPVEGMRSYVAMLLQCGMTADEIRVMFHHNPARIARLD